MNRFDRFDPFARNDDHDLPITTAVSGALLGATLGILGGPVGMALAAIGGAVLGVFGGWALERQRDRQEAFGTERVGAAPPSIEPPRADDGANDLHVRHHPVGHRHYAYPQGFAVGSMFLRPSV
jgi:hypothetical protein